MEAAKHVSTARRWSHAKSHRLSTRPPFECIALLLQGGGALGSYQAGVYEALAEAGLHPDWVAGISIGAINSAIIAGNPPAERVAKLRSFWEEITANPLLDAVATLGEFWLTGDFARGLFNQMSAAVALSQGAPSFFSSRQPSVWLNPYGALGATSFYETKQLRNTLERLVDFDRINSGETRLSMGAVNVRNGNFVYFDTTTHTISPDHVMASGSLPPGFPAIKIEGEFYWDGGLISNTPLEWVAEHGPRQDTLAFQVDLWSAVGELPRNLAEVATRQKEIQFSSRTRANTDQFKRAQRLRATLAALLQKLPEDLRNADEVKTLSDAASRKLYNLVHLIYRPRDYEGQSKDYEFSNLSMRDHWRAGYHDAARTLRHPEVLAPPTNPDGVSTFDLARDGRE